MPERKSREPLPKAAVKGSLHVEWKRCGKPTCRCRSGALHGPYYSRRWRVGGRQRKEYIPKDVVLSVLLAIETRRQTAREMRQLKRSLQEQRKNAT